MEGCISSYPVQALREKYLCNLFHPIIHRTRTDNLKFCIETQKTQHCESGIIFPTVQVRKLRIRVANKFLCAYMLSCFSRVQLCNPIACQAPLFMRFQRQEYWSGLPCPPLGDLPDPGIKPTSLSSPALAGWFFTTGATREAQITKAPQFTWGRGEGENQNQIKRERQGRDKLEEWD